MGKYDDYKYPNEIGKWRYKMKSSRQVAIPRRYKEVNDEKAVGATYTPKILADFVAKHIVELGKNLFERDGILRILDPAVGDGELLVSLLEHLYSYDLNIEVYGFDTDQKAINSAADRITKKFPSVNLYFELRNFLEFVADQFCEVKNGPLFRSEAPKAYDLIIANPPYVRTQIIGATQAQLLAKQFNLSGRVDLYYPFILGMAKLIKPKGIAGIIVSNRFMTTRSGASVRRAICHQFNVRHVWDLGDTKLFNAAVLPAILLVEGKNGHTEENPFFTSIYETKGPADNCAEDQIDALSRRGIVQIKNGKIYQVSHGKLDISGATDRVWRVATDKADSWLSTVKAHSWGTFRDLGKIRVGVKTCSDKVFIRSDWCQQQEGEPELLRPVITHHIGRRFKATNQKNKKSILYPHEFENGKRRAVDLLLYPKTKGYLERHRLNLESRKYVIDSGREWYEIWVPQDPAAWDQPKLVFRDISEKPEFWIDLDKSVVNGDCYWLVCKNPAQNDLLWLACAVANSTFIEAFYDKSFNNKLYAGRRRFMTQYVEQFPIPRIDNLVSKTIIQKSKEVYDCIPSPKADFLQKELDALVWDAFGLIFEEVSR